MSLNDKMAFSKITKPTSPSANFVQLPTNAVLPDVALPAKTSMENFPTEVRDLFKREIEMLELIDVVAEPHIWLDSDYGFFKVYSYIFNFPVLEREFLVLFYNKRTKRVFRTIGVLAGFFIDQSRKKLKIENIIISNDRPGNNANNVISFLGRSASTLHSGIILDNAEYRSFIPVKKDTLVAYTEEYKLPDTLKVRFENWHDVKESVLNNWEKSRLVRSSGMPSQIVLHETVSRGPFTAKALSSPKSSNTESYNIPHFSVNTDNVVQLVDIAEKTYQARILNDTSVGIEFQNIPVRDKAFDKKQNKWIDILPDLNTGIFITTKIKGRLGELFIPLSFSLTRKTDYFSVTFPAKNLVTDSRVLLETKYPGLITDDNGKFKLQYCSTPQFENLCTLLNALCDSKKNLFAGINLRDPSNWLSFIEKNGKIYYLIQQAYQFDKNVKSNQKKGKKHSYPFHYVADLRKPGIVAHGNIGGASDAHIDGHLQTLYAYFRLFRQLEPSSTLQQILDLLMSPTTNDEKNGVSFDVKVVLDGVKDNEPLFREVRNHKPVLIENVLEL